MALFHRFERNKQNISDHDRLEIQILSSRLCNIACLTTSLVAKHCGHKSGRFVANLG